MHVAPGVKARSEAGDPPATIDANGVNRSMPAAVALANASPIVVAPLRVITMCFSQQLFGVPLSGRASEPTFVHIGEQYCCIFRGANV